MRPSHRALRRLLLLCGFVMVLGLYLAHLTRRAPDWYRRAAADSPEQALLASSAESKYIRLQDMAGRSRSENLRESYALSQGAAPPTAEPIEPSTVSFTEAELNATFRKWSREYPSALGRWLTDPVIALETDRIIVAGHPPNSELVLSFHVRPSIDGQGMLHLDVVSVSAGSLPIPQGLLGSQRRRLHDALEARLASAAPAARLDGVGAANQAAVDAATARLFLNALDKRPSPAIIFIRAPDAALPVRLSDLSVDRQTLTVTAEPLNPAQRAALESQLRSP